MEIKKEKFYIEKNIFYIFKELIAKVLIDFYFV
jgi:hypothetical protein